MPVDRLPALTLTMAETIIRDQFKRIEACRSYLTETHQHGETVDAETALSYLGYDITEDET